MSYNIYICGVGGQGIIKTSVIIGEAAMNQGLNVVMSEIHGMSQRGGSVSTELKIGDFNSSIIPEGNADGAGRGFPLLPGRGYTCSKHGVP